MDRGAGRRGDSSRRHVAAAEVGLAIVITEPSRGNARRVLVTEDDLTSRRVIAAALGDEGHLVDEAAEGEVVLWPLEQRHPDVIVLDMKMSGTDGRQFVQCYRE